MKNVYRSIGLIGLASLIGSCGGDGPVAPPPPTTASVTMSATTGTLVPGANVQLSATARDQSGNALSRMLAWTTSDAAKATVSSTGMVSGVAPGSVTITAAVDGKSAASAITVLDGGVVTNAGGSLTLLSGAVQIDVPSGAVPSATNISLVESTAYANDPRVIKDTPFDFGPTGTQFAKPVSVKIKYAAANLPQGTEEAALQLYLSTATGWQAVEGSLVDLSAKTVAADVSHFSVYAILTPVPVAAVAIRSPPNKPPLIVGDTAQLTATLTDAQGGTLTNRAVTWATSNAAIASVTSSGLVTGVAPGTATVSATAGGVTSSLLITVTPVPIAGVAVTLLPQAVEVGQTSQASAVITDAGGNILTGRVVSWSSDNSAVATVSASGEVTAIAPGAAQITATSEGKTGSASITVAAAPVASVGVSLASGSVVAGQTTQATATVLDAKGNTLAGRSITWASNNTSIATVSSSGLVTAVAAGTAQIIATSETKSGQTPLIVTPVPVATVSVSPTDASVIVGATQQLTATTKDGNGGTLTGRTIAWSSTDATIASVDVNGLVTAHAIGSATISATSEGKSGSSTITVTAVPVASVTVTLTPNSITAVETSQAGAVALDANGAVLAGRPISWTSSNTAVATVSTQGVVSAVTEGTAQITATSEGKSGSATITITPAPVATITLNPPSITVVSGATQQLTATLEDAHHNPLTGRTLDWSSDDPAVATVSASGLVTAGAPGAATIAVVSETKVATALVTVTPIPVASVSVSLASGSVFAGQTTQATATPLDAGGNALTGRAIVWTSDNLSVATVSSSGLVTAVSAGTANIVGTSEGKNGAASLTVVPVLVASLTLSAPITPVLLGQTQQLTALPKDGSGTILTGRTVSWVSSNPAILSVSAPSSVSSSSGATIGITAAGVGTAIITATSESAPSASTPVITVNPIPVATVTVTPPSATLALGVNSTQQLTATLKDANANVLTGRIVTWTSSNPSAATVDANGFVTAVGGGSTTITATSEGQTGTASITVTVPVWTVTVSPSSATLTVGLTHQLTATTKDVNGSVLTGRVVTWSSSDPSLATVSSTGLVTAVASGIAVITATSEGKSGTSSITVTPIPVASVSVSLSGSTIQVGQTTQATATTFDSNNVVLTGRVVTWSTGNAAIATVSSTGLVTATGVGSTAIIATSEGKTGNATINVIAVPVFSVSVSPSSASIIAGATQQLSAETRDANNGLLTGRVVSWSSNNTAVATVSSSGLVTAVSVGGATITATSEGKTGTSSVTVLPVPVASVNVSLLPNSITAVGTSQATATTLDSHGGVLTGRVVTWSSGNTAIATVNAQGVVTAVAVGTVSIVAASEGQSGNATLTVTQAPVASVTVSPSSATVVQGSTEQLSATLKDAHGSILSRAVTWSSSNDAIASVSPTGLVTANAVGGATITATSEGQSGTSSVTVSAVPVASVTVTLASGTITDAQTTQATAVVRDAGGNVLVGRTITWISDNSAVATVSSTGLVTPVAAGSAQIRASTGGQSGTAALTVIPRVAAVTVTPSSANIVIGSTRQLAAETRDANNNVLTGRTITWNSDNSAVATVSATGLVTSLALGSATITAMSEGVAGTSAISVVPVPVNLVTVSLGSTTLTVGQTTQATATTRDANGNILTGRSITWSSGNSARATVSPTGLVTAVGAGSVQIIAMSEGKTGSATLTVNPVPVATVTVGLAPNSITAVGTSQGTATTLDANGNPLTGRVVTWTSSNQAVATVDAQGLVTAVAVGTSDIIATSEGKTGSAPITVTQAPVATITVSLASSSINPAQTTQATATVLDARGRVLTGRTIGWSSSNNGVASVGPATGLVTGVGAGMANIIATSEGQTGSAALTVTLAPVATVTVSAPATSMVVGGSQQLTATMKDANGNVLTGRIVAWVSSNPAVLTVSSSGNPATVTAVGVGTATITATSESVSSSPTPPITANPIPVASVTVSLNATSITAVGTTQATATTLDANGNPLTGRVVTWSSSNTAAATVDPQGVVTAVAVGTSSITATSEGKSGTATINVTPAPVATVTVSLASTSINAVQTTQATATLLDAKGRALTGRTVSWSSDNTLIATVNQTSGLVTAVSPGGAHIIATSEGITGNATLTVTAAPVASVAVNPATANLVLGITPTQQLTAVLSDANGHTLSGRLVTWTSSNGSAATVDANGLVTAVAAGASTITATSEGKSGTSSITVSLAPVASVSVGLNPSSITAVGTSQATATTLDANGGTLTGRAVTWTSSNASVATVSAQGVVAGIAAGTSSITATSEGKNGSSTITVTPAPVDTVTVSLAASSINAVQTTQATAILHDAQGRELTGRTVDWSSDNISVATVSSTTGLVTAVSPGTANIIAASEGKRDSAAVTVTPAPVDTVTVSPAAVNLVIGITPPQQLTVVTKDAKGTVLTGRTVAWVSSNTAAATVNETGLVTAVGAGSTTITATSEGKSGTSLVTVSLAPVASVTVSAPTTPMVIGATQQLTALTKDANDHVLNGRVITWASSNTAVLTVSASGSQPTVTAVSVGTATITATSETVSSSPTPTITVIPPPVASVTLSFPTTAMVVGGTQTLTARPRDGSGNVLSDRTVNWVSSDPTVLAVSAPSSVSSSTGATVTLTAVAAGNATVTATSESAPSATTPTIQVSPALASGPLRVSDTNRRYFADPSGRPVYLTGSEYWKTIQDNTPSNPPAPFDYSGFLDFLQRNNHNFTRLYMWEQAKWSVETTVANYFLPTLYERVVPTDPADTALDGGPKFDLTKLNPAYLARVRQRAIDAGSRGIYVSVMMFNGFSVDRKGETNGSNPWLAHPFNASNNVNGINGDPNGDQSGIEAQTLSIPEITALQDAYVKAVVDAVNDLDNVIYEISNESDPSSDAWQYHMIDLIRSYEATKPKRHPIGMTVPYPTVPEGSNDDVMNSSADWVSMNGNVDNPAVADGTKVDLSDTDHLCGICGDPSWPWKSFTRGHNTLFMDGYDGSPGVGDPLYHPDEARWPEIRKNMGYARSYAVRMNLANDTPHPELCSSNFCLAGTEYLVLLPTGGSVSVNLSVVSGTRTVEWFNPADGTTTAGGTVAGGSTVVFTAPFSGMAVLFIHP